MDQSKQNYDWTLIETGRQLQEFYEEHCSTAWLAFDTEFIPERYFRSRLCLISAVTTNGNYVIDVIKISDLSPFIRLVENSDIQKFTNAGENDYRNLELD